MTSTRRKTVVAPSSCETEEHARRRATSAPTDRTLHAAAQMFEAAGSPQRLALLVLLRQEALTVADIAAAVKREPSLVSQHLGILRAARLVRGVRQGKFVVYELFDAHARQFIDSALAHAGRIGFSGARS